MEKSNIIEQKEMEALENDCKRYLHQALENYLRCLKVGNIYDLKIFRVVALWFENSSDSDVNDMIEKHLQVISSHKFLPLYYQLAARMSSRSSGKDNFQVVLGEYMWYFLEKAILKSDK